MSQLVAKYKYDAAAPDELSIYPGDLILGLELQGEWWYGELYGR